MARTASGPQHQANQTKPHYQPIKEIYITYWKETTKTQNKLKCYLTLKRNFILANYLSTVKDPKLRKALTMYRLSEHSLAIEKGRHRQS